MTDSTASLSSFPHRTCVSSQKVQFRIPSDKTSGRIFCKSAGKEMSPADFLNHIAFMVGHRKEIYEEDADALRAIAELL